MYGFGRQALANAVGTLVAAAVVYCLPAILAGVSVACRGARVAVGLIGDFVQFSFSTPLFTTASVLGAVLGVALGVATRTRLTRPY